ncbi:hypothetical protein KR018_005251 [Drosophila ironensis]|nr:hypothetical protein KR018_005251 [Drosophila ironensis]
MEQFMKYANFFYKAVGIEPYSLDLVPRKEGWRTWILFAANVLNLSLVATGESIYLRMAYDKGNILEAVTVASYIGFIIVGSSKMFCILWNKPDLSAMMRELRGMHPRGKADEEAYRLQEHLRTCSRISRIFSLLYSLLIWTFNLYCIMEFLVYDKWLNLRVVGKTLPYLMYIPWEWQDHWSYYLLLFSQNFAGYTSAAGQISTDLLICAVATLIVMHFEYLSDNLRNHKLSGVWEEDSLFLANMVRYHERLLRLSSKMNELFGIPLLLNFMVSSFVICFVGFQMTVGVPADMIFKLFLFLISSMSQVYLICYYGQLVADSSFGVSEAAYSQDWHNGDIRYKRGLLLIIVRAQNITYLKATIFINITRDTMTDLLQLSYKFFALLRTMYVN